MGKSADADQADGFAISPVLQVGLRSGVALCVIVVSLVLAGRKPRLADLAWKPGLLAGLVFGVEYLIICIGLQYTTAARMVMFIYTAPVFAAVGLHFSLREQRLSPHQWGGLGISFIGMAFAFASRSQLDGGQSTLLGDACGLAGGALWGALTVLLRTSRLSKASPIEGLAYQLLGAFCVLTPAAFMLDDGEVTMTGFAWFSMTIQTLLIALLSFFVWMVLLSRYNASALGVMTFMTPVFGVVFGMFFLDESVGSHFLWGAGGVLLGVMIVNSRRI